MSMITQPVRYSQVTASGVINGRPGELYGIIAVASTTAIVQVWDNATAGSGNLLYASVAALTAGQVVTFNGLGIQASAGLYFTLVSGTGTFNILYV